MSFPTARPAPTRSTGGAPLLLEILGGILVAATVACAGPLVMSLLQPFQRDTAAGASAYAFAHIAYLGILLNLFRQIHGLAIVVADDEYDAEVGAHLSLFARVVSLAGLVLVLAFPAMLLAVICSNEIAPMRYLIDYLEVEPTKNGIRVILAFIAATALAYLLWDFVCARECATNAIPSRSRRWHLNRAAMSYREFLHNWMVLCAYSLLLAALAFILAVGVATASGIPLVPRIMGDKALLVVLLALTYGYSMTDYYVNRNFYFRHQPLARLRAAQGVSDMHLPLPRLLAIVGIGMAVGVMALFYFALQPPPRLVLQLKWTYNAGFAGDLIAKERYWKDYDVDLREGGMGIDPIKQVAGGSAQFGVATGDQILLAIVNEKAPLIAIGLVYQENPLTWICRADSGINGPADLRGKTVGLTYTDDKPLFDAMLERVGLGEQDLSVKRVGFDTTPFLRNEVHAFPVFRNTQGTELALLLAKDRIETRFVGPSDVGIVAYSNLYFTTRAYAETHRDEVIAFLHGSLRGWTFAQGEIREAAAIVSKYDKASDADVIKACVVATNRLVKPTENTLIGSMSKEGWEQTQNILFAGGQITEKCDVHRVFTNEYLEAARRAD